MNLSSIDLNLLLAFDALMEERHVTRAAGRVGLSQPAMSNALARLRTLLGDPLLVRGRGEMIPTERARSLARPIRHALRELEMALDPVRPFSPGESSRVFTVTTTGYADPVLLPQLIARLTREAPGAALRVIGLGGEPVRAALDAAEADLALGIFDRLPGDLHRQVLLADRLVAVARKDHPALRRRLTLKQFVDLPHVLVAPRGGTIGAVDQELERAGLQRNIVLWVPHYPAATRVAATTDCLVAMPERLARAIAPEQELRILDLPVKTPDISVSQVWHARVHHEPPHQWFRRLIAEVAKASG